MATTIKENLHPLWKGIIGVAAPTGGVIASCLPQIEAWLRIASLTVGLIVGLLTAYSLVKNLRKK